jgi:predicted nucleic acid-binding protein
MSDGMRYMLDTNIASFIIRGANSRTCGEACR